MWHHRPKKNGIGSLLCLWAVSQPRHPHPPPPHLLTLPSSHNNTEDSKPPTRLTRTRRSAEKRTARGTASSLPAVIPPQKTLANAHKYKQ